MRTAPGMWFSAAFLCPGIRDNGKVCGHVLEIETFQAIVDGPGLEVGCIVCHTMFLVTNEGATPITDSDLRYLNTESGIGAKANRTSEQVADVDQHIPSEEQGSSS